MRLLIQDSDPSDSVCRSSHQLDWLGMPSTSLSPSIFCLGEDDFRLRMDIEKTFLPIIQECNLE